MKVRLRTEAVADLNSIIGYYHEIAPESLPNILNDIQRSIELVRRFPHLGTPLSDRSLRRLMTRKYHFKIAYQPTHEAILVIGIFRYQNRET
jgi:plasmid stabilization system protein ParE